MAQIPFRIAVAACCSLICSAAGAQQNYPNKPVVMVLPIAPGSSTDRDGRVIMNKVSENVGQQIVFDYKPGASPIGMGYVARSTPDGYTFLLMSAAISLVPLVEDELPFDGIKAFAPVSLLAKKWGTFTATMTLPANNVAEFVAYVKANPGVVNYATSGAGKGQHLTGLWIQSMTGVEMTYVHYKGGGPAQADLIAGRVHVASMALSTAAALQKAGKLKILGMANLTRNPAYPDIPTLHEQGWKDFEYISWMGVSAPAKTPTAIVNRMSTELSKAVKSPDVVKRLGAENLLVGSTPDEFRRVISNETETWRKIVKANNIKVELE